MRHHTPFAYQVMTVDPDQRDHIPRPVRRGESLPPDCIYLRRLADARDYVK